VGGGQANPGEPERVLIAQASVRDDLISRLRSDVAARDLVFEKVDAAETKTAGNLKDGARVETAAYVVNPSTAPDARLVVDITLRHR
jgi:hypothetical protein